MRRGFVAMLVTLLLIPGSVFAFEFNAPSALANLLVEIEVFIENLFAPPAAHYAEPTTSAAAAAAAEPSPVDTQSPQVTPSGNPFAATSTNGAPLTVETAPPPERTVYLQPQTIERTVVQSAPLPDDLVHTSLLAELLAAFESKISAQVSAITTQPLFSQQVAAGGNGVLTYGAASAIGGGGSSGGVSLSDVNAMVASAIQAALSAIDHLTANTVTATNANLASATVTTLHVTGTATLDTALTPASGGTGFSSAPTYGQLLIGQANGTYALVSTSSLGITGGGSSASSTLLSDANTFLGANTFSGVSNFTNTSSNWAGTFSNLTASQLIGMGFSTTSAIYYITNNQGLAFSTTSANYYLASAQGLAFSTTSASYFLSQNQGAGFATTSATYFVNSSTTIPKTYAANTFTNTNTFGGSSIFNGALTLGSLNGPLQANGGVVSATSSIGTGYGGTGLTSAPAYGQLLLGQSNGTYALISTSSLGLGTGTVSSGTQGQFAFYNANGTTVTATSSLYLAQSGNIGIGTTTPSYSLDINGGLRTSATSSFGGLLNVQNLESFHFADMYGNGSTNGIASAISNCMATSTNCLVVVPSSYPITETVPGEAGSSPSTSGTNVSILDYRYGDYETVLNPQGNLTTTHTTWKDWTANYTSLPPLQGPNMNMLQINQNAIDGGTNQLANGYWNKTTWMPLWIRNYGYTPGQLDSVSIDTTSHSIGDVLGMTLSSTCDGGLSTEGDEGCEALDQWVSQGSVAYAGTLTGSPSTGASSVTVSPTQGSGTQGSGRYLIDLAAGKTITAGTISAISGSGPYTVTGSGTTWPVSTVSATLNATMNTSGTYTVTPTSFTIGSISNITTSTLLCIADGGSYETLYPTSVNTGAGTFTATFKKPHSSDALVTAGGLCGYIIDMTADDVTNSIVSGVVGTLRQAWPVISSPTSNTALVWLSAQGRWTGYNGRWTNATGSNSYVLYPAAEVTSVASGNQVSNTLTLAPNNVAWSSSDSVELLHYPAIHLDGSNQSYVKYFPSPGIAASDGMGMVFSGIWSGQDKALSISNNTPSSLYAVNGGTLAAPYLSYITGQWGAGFWFSQPTAGALLAAGCGSSGCTGTQTILEMYNGTGIGFDRMQYSGPNQNFSLTAGNRSAMYTFATSSFSVPTTETIQSGNLLLNSGSIGIGTTSPSEKLTVRSSDNTQSTNILSAYANNGTQGIGIGYDTVRRTGTNADADISLLSKGVGYIYLGRDTSSTGIRFGPSDSVANNIYFGNPSAHTIGITADSGNTISISQASNSAAGLTVNTTNGNVGIATTSPDMLLTVGSNGPTGSVAHFENSSETCVTQRQLAALLSQAGTSNLQTSVTSSGTSQATNSGNPGNVNSTSPVISINGANPATITVGTAYADLGATITAPKADVNLDLTVVVDNATSTDGTVQIDTSRPGTHTILYTVTDPSGLTGSATRTVIVSAPQQTPPPANDNSPAPTAANDNTAPTTTTTSTGQ